MFFELTTDNIYLEYINDIITVEYKDTFFKVAGHEISNIANILANMKLNVFIDTLIIDNIKIAQDQNGLYINNDFFIEDKDLNNLIYIIVQANSMRSTLLRPSSYPADTGGGVTNPTYGGSTPP